MKIVPELLANDTFLRYYRMWQENPRSVVFVAVAEMCMKHGMLEEAIAICKEGLSYHPRLVSGHVVLGRVYIQTERFEEARAEALEVLHEVPNNESAKELLHDAERGEANRITTPVVNPAQEPITLELEDEDYSSLYDQKEALKAFADEVMPITAVPVQPDELPETENGFWETVTMARVYAEQGYTKKARDICTTILEYQPQHEEAQHLLHRLESRS
jgi:tetratricopeptide (TPR) repeat protein